MRGSKKNSRKLLLLQVRRFSNDDRERLQVVYDGCDCTRHRRRCRFDDRVYPASAFPSCITISGHHSPRWRW